MDVSHFVARAHGRRSANLNRIFLWQLECCERIILWSLCTMHSTGRWTLISFSVVLLFAFCCRLSRCRCPVCRVCICVFCISCPMMHKNSQPFFRSVPLAIWQRAQSTYAYPYRVKSLWQSDACNFRLFYFYFSVRHSPFAWIVMTKTFGYLKGHMSFWSMPGEIVAIDECAHTLATTC